MSPIVSPKILTARCICENRWFVGKFSVESNSQEIAILGAHLINMILEIQHPVTGKIFEISDVLFPIKMTWEDANLACKNLGAGWRLPLKCPKENSLLELCEMEAIGEEFSKISSYRIFKRSYWCGMSQHHFKNWVFHLNENPYWALRSKIEHHYVLAVREN